MSKKEKYKRYGYEDAYDTEKENDWTNRLNLDDCIEIMNNQYNEIEELKQQLAEKDKRIAELKERVIEEEDFKLAYKHDLEQLRKQVCDEIRERIENDFEYDCEYTYGKLVEVIDQVEKGE